MKEKIHKAKMIFVLSWDVNENGRWQGKSQIFKTEEEIKNFGRKLTNKGGIRNLEANWYDLTHSVEEVKEAVNV